MDRAARAITPARDTFHYSNVGYAIIRSILEESTGTEFFENIRTTLLTPLGITEVGPFAEPDDWQACIAGGDPGHYVAGTWLRTRSYDQWDSRSPVRRPWTRTCSSNVASRRWATSSPLRDSRFRLTAGTAVSAGGA